MRARWSAAGTFGLLILGFWLLSLAYFDNQDCYCPFGQPTNQVTVPANSPAAQRGFAYPGEGTPVFFLLGSPDMSNLTLRYAIAVLVIAVLCAIVGGRDFFRILFLPILGAAFGGAFFPGGLIAFYVSLLRENLVVALPIIIVAYIVVWFALLTPLFLRSNRF